VGVRGLVEGREPLERGRTCTLATLGAAGPDSAVLAAAVAAAVSSLSEAMLAPQDEQNLEFSARGFPQDWHFSMNGLVVARYQSSDVSVERLSWFNS